MPGIIGKKIGMTSVYSAAGKNIPCTVIEAGPCVVTQVRTLEKDGYTAVQLAYGEKKEKNTSHVYYKKLADALIAYNEIFLFGPLDAHRLLT